MSTARFTHQNPGFECQNCGKNVPPLVSGCRNHCPFCLVCKHVDIYPGDRLNPCKGLMKAVSYDRHKKKGLMLVFECSACGQRNRNKSALEDGNQSDCYDSILKLNSFSR